MTFDGTLLDRGFWIYAIRLTGASGKNYLYIGRTGDNSSKNAASPFQRIVNHLNLRPSAKANSLAKLITKHRILTATTHFRMTAVGPLFPEQMDFESHKPIRNQMTAIEKAVADHFRSKGYDILGKHDDNPAKNPEMTRQVIAALEEDFEEKTKTTEGQ